jgi:hypothetical protein
MKITFENDQEVLDLIHNALCNGLSTLAQYGITLNTRESKYRENRQDGDCYEDVLTRILAKGGNLYFEDEEDESSIFFNLEMAKENLSTHKPIFHNIINMIIGNDDANDADAILQACIYGEVIYG